MGTIKATENTAVLKIIIFKAIRGGVEHSATKFYFCSALLGVAGSAQFHYLWGVAEKVVAHHHYG